MPNAPREGWCGQKHADVDFVSIRYWCQLTPFDSLTPPNPLHPTQSPSHSHLTHSTSRSFLHVSLCPSLSMSSHFPRFAVHQSLGIKLRLGWQAWWSNSWPRFSEIPESHGAKLGFSDVQKHNTYTIYTYLHKERKSCLWKSCQPFHSYHNYHSCKNDISVKTVACMFLYIKCTPWASSFDYFAFQVPWPIWLMDVTSFGHIALYANWRTRFDSPARFE